VGGSTRKIADVISCTKFALNWSVDSQRADSLKINLSFNAYITLTTFQSTVTLQCGLHLQVVLNGHQLTWAAIGAKSRKMTSFDFVTPSPSGSLLEFFLSPPFKNGSAYLACWHSPIRIKLVGVIT
jgi:hypothetical protein